MDPYTMSPVGVNGSADETLLGILRRIQDVQAQPLVPENPFAQLGTILSGFSSGLQGQANPALAQFRQRRQDQLIGLREQAGVAHSIAQLETQRGTRAETLKQHAFQMYDKMKNDPDVNVREAGIKFGQQNGFLPTSIDAHLAALKGGKEFETRHDQVVTLVQNGEDPFSPKYQGLYDPSLFGGIVQATRDALLRGGPAAANSLKLKPETAQNVLTIEAAALNSAPEANLTSEQKLRRQGLNETLKIDKEGTVGQQMIRSVRAEAAQKALTTGQPMPPDSVIIEDANARLQDKQNLEHDLATEAARLRSRGILASDADVFQWKQKRRIEVSQELADARAAALFQNQGLSDTDKNAIGAMRLAKTIVQKLKTEFTPDERASYVGYLKYPARQLAQFVVQDPKFAQFQNLVYQAKDLAFGEGGKQLTPFEASIVFGFVPTGREMSPIDFEAKLKNFDDRADFIVQERIRNSITPKKMLEAPPGPPQPKSPAGLGFHYEIQKDGTRRVVLD